MCVCVCWGVIWQDPRQQLESCSSFGDARRLQKKTHWLSTFTCQCHKLGKTVQGTCEGHSELLSHTYMQIRNTHVYNIVVAFVCQSTSNPTLVSWVGSCGLVTLAKTRAKFDLLTQYVPHQHHGETNPTDVQIG